MGTCECGNNKVKTHGCRHDVESETVEGHPTFGMDRTPGGGGGNTRGHHPGKAWSLDEEAGKTALSNLLDRFRSPVGAYDVLIPGNGGIHSASLAHILKSRYQMNPLTVTWTPNLPTEIGRGNLKRLVHAGLDNIFVSPNGQVHRKLTQLCFTRQGHPMLPAILGQRGITGKTALYHGIGLVFFARRPDYRGLGRKHDYHPDFENRCHRIEDICPSELAKRFGITRGDLSFYHPADPKEMFNAGIEIHYLSDYVSMDTREALAYAAAHTGFKAAPHREEGTYSRCHEIDDKMTPLHYYMGRIKTGIGRASIDAGMDPPAPAGMERSDMDRFEAEAPAMYMKDYLEYFEMEEAPFWETVEKFRETRLWTRDNGRWRLNTPGRKPAGVPCGAITPPGFEPIPQTGGHPLAT